MTKAHLAILLFATGTIVLVLGFLQADPRFAQPSHRPYAYISVIAVGGILMIAGALVWHDR